MLDAVDQYRWMKEEEPEATFELSITDKVDNY